MCNPLLLLALLTVESPPGACVLDTRCVRIAYQTDRPGDVVLSVTRDGGKTWAPAEPCRRQDGSIIYQTAHDGLWGFRVDPADITGPVRMPPPGVAPQIEVVIDTKPPVLQIGQVAPDPDLPSGRSLVIPVTLFDENLSPWPLDLEYRPSGQLDWSLIAKGKPAAPHHTWNVPDRISGQVEIRVSAVDLAGNQSLRTAMAALDQLPAPPAGGLITTRPAEAAGRTASRGRPATRHAEPPVQDFRKALAEFEAAKAHLARNEIGIAEDYLRQALEQSPDFADAHLRLADVLWRSARYDDAAQHYRSAAAIGGDRGLDATFGLAMTSFRKRQYPRAEELLDTFLRGRPGDAAAWLNKGDVLSLMNRRDEARGAWLKAAEVDPNAHEVIRRARSRLQTFAGGAGQPGASP